MEIGDIVDFYIKIFFFSSNNSLLFSLSQAGAGGGAGAPPLSEVTDRLSQMEQLVSQLKEMIREKDVALHSKDQELKVIGASSLGFDLEQVVQLIQDQLEWLGLTLLTVMVSSGEILLVSSLSVIHTNTT